MLLLIGESPSSPAGLALGGRCGDVIAKLAGTTAEEFLRRTDRHNLIIKQLKNWDPRRARRNAAFLEAQFAGYDAIVLCGRRVATAFGYGDEPFLASRWLDRYQEIVIFPHPSGKNRWWNNPDNKERASRVMTRLWEMYT